MGTAVEVEVDEIKNSIPRSCAQVNHQFIDGNRKTKGNVVWLAAGTAKADT